MHMFERLGFKRIEKNEQGIGVSFPIGFAAMVGGSRILEYLYREETHDYTTCEYSKSRLMKGQFHCDWFQQLKVRFLTRASGYVITVCSLDGILTQSYRNFVSHLRNLGYKAITPADKGAALIASRRGEISDYEFYRHKVFAHTSFADPRKDSASLQHSSLMFYSGNLLFVKEDHLSLGGGSVIVDGIEEEVPEVSIVGGHETITDHYMKWETMFTDILDRLSQDELTKKIESVSLL